MARRHWTVDVAEAIRARARDLKPVIAAVLEGIGSRPPEPEPDIDSVTNFLSMTPQERYAVLTGMSPDAYREFTTGMMRQLANRYGPAAQALFPLLQGGDMTRQLEQVKQELPEYLGYDPFAGGLYA